MKNVLLVAINASFSHSSLSLLCLRHASKIKPRTMEFTINESVSSIVRAVALSRPDAVGFSCYVWNIDHVLRAASSIKSILPRCFIFLGGPEVSFGCEEFMRSHPFADMIIAGPGEIPFSRFMEGFENGDITGTPSAFIRDGEQLIATQPAPAYDMNDTPFMYGDLSAFENKIIYYETSRGCPFNCAYCISAESSVTYLPLERVTSELEYFLRSDVMQVKLVDRTFNFPAGRAKQILRALIDASLKYPDSRTNFHLEITASLLDDEILSLLREAKRGLIQLEAGIQSTNPETLKAVNRSVDADRLLRNARILCGMNNIHVHADLIAGLPLESYSSFAKSLGDAFSLRPGTLQLGFLKLLKGSPMRSFAEKYGIVYTEYAPYEVLRTNDISFEELSSLHLVEQALNLLYNSGHCRQALEHIIPHFDSAFDFFETFSRFLEAGDYFSQPHKLKELFANLYEFALNHSCPKDIVIEALALDWLCIERPRSWPEPLKHFGKRITDSRSFLSDPQNIKTYLPHYYHISPKDISRHILIASFEAIFPGKTYVLFDYEKKAGEDGFYQTIDA